VNDPLLDPGRKRQPGEPMSIGACLAAWHLAGAATEAEAQDYAATMRRRGATEAEVSAAWDAFQEAQERNVQRIYSTPTETPDQRAARLQIEHNEAHGLPVPQYLRDLARPTPTRGTDDH
jgi:hypothetical protein